MRDGVHERGDIQRHGQRSDDVDPEVHAQKVAAAHHRRQRRLGQEHHLCKRHAIYCLTSLQGSRHMPTRPTCLISSADACVCKCWEPAHYLPGAWQARWSQCGAPQAQASRQSIQSCKCICPTVPRLMSRVGSRRTSTMPDRTWQATSAAGGNTARRRSSKKSATTVTADTKIVAGRPSRYRLALAFQTLWSSRFRLSKMEPAASAQAALSGQETL